jgi:tRNA pseudouridine32 synthase/23S rRNA pseudouridine746 synthase
MCPDLDTLYEDDHLLAVNKPAGLLSVPGRGPLNQDSIQSRAQACYTQALIVHRLDCATSGVMLLAKTKAAQGELNRQFRERETTKQYQAITYGDCPAPQGDITFPLITDWPNRPKQKICYDTGKASLTQYQLLDTESRRHRLLLTPVTGRSHQLRVHTMAIGMPIIGDVFYAPASIAKMSTRLLLHAHRLSITHPQDGTPLTLEAPLPF